MKETRSCSVRWSNRSPTDPATNCSVPSGSSPDSTISSTSRAVRNAVGLAGLTTRRHAGQERGGELLQRPPHREVERVDLHGHAVQRRADVLAEERAAAAQRLDGALDVDGVVGQLALGLARVRRAASRCRRRRRTSSRASVAPVRAETRVELVAVLAQVPGERLEQAGALVEGQLPQRRAADPPAVLQHGGHVDAGGGDPGDLLAGHRVVQRPALVGGGVPAALHVAAQHVLIGGSSVVSSTDRTFTVPVVPRDR